MAVPRVFVSSTFYDLQHVRNDIRSFLEGLGYEPVLHDKGNVAYTQDVTLEKACYNELSTCDIVVCIIGGKYGTQSADSDKSITMEELNTAMRDRKKIFIYIQENVYNENLTYLKNADNENFIPAHVDDIRVHKYIAELKQTVKYYPIQSFVNVTDIIDNLRRQFAGLFESLLSKEATLTEAKTFNDLQETSDQIRKAILEFKEEKDDLFVRFGGSALATLGPVQYLLKSILHVEKYRVFIPDQAALQEYLTNIGYSVEVSDFPFDDMVCRKKIDITNYCLTIDSSMFGENGKIIENRNKAELESKIKMETTIEKNFSDIDLPF